MNIKALLTALVISAVPFVAHADDDYDYNDCIEHNVRADQNYAINKQKAITKLQKQGYRVSKIEADDHRGQGVFDIEAYKGKKKYDIKMSYPALKIIKKQRDYDD